MQLEGFDKQFKKYKDVDLDLSLNY